MARSSTRPRPTALGAILNQSPELRPEPGQVSAALWSELVGFKIAQCSRPDRVRQGVLWVKVTSSLWAQELSLHSDTIKERLRAAGIAVSELRFRVDQNAGTTSPARAVPPVRVQRASLSAELEAHLSAVEDPGLRDAIANAAALSMGRQLSRQRTDTDARASHAGKDDAGPPRRPRRKAGSDRS